MRNNFYKKALNWVLPIVVVIVILTSGIVEGGIVLIAYLIYRFVSERDKIFSYIAKKKYLKGKLDKSVKYYKKAYETGIAEPKVCISYAYSLILSGDYQTAREIVAETSNMEGREKIETAILICNAVLRWKDDNVLPIAISMMETARKELKNTSYYKVLGRMYIYSGNIKKARAVNEEAYKYNNKNEGVLENLLIVYCNMEEYDRAVKVTEKLMKLKPYTPDAYYYSALAYEKTGNKSKAQKLYKKADKYQNTVISIKGK